MDFFDEEPAFAGRTSAYYAPIYKGGQAEAFLNDPDDEAAIFLDGAYYCCDVGCHIVHPLVQRHGDTYTVCAAGPDGDTVFADLDQTQVTCFLGLDKDGLCDCQGGAHEG